MSCAIWIPEVTIGCVEKMEPITKISEIPVSMICRILSFYAEKRVSSFCLFFQQTKPGPGCSKLTTSLVNVSLKFQTLISDIRQYFLLKDVRRFCSAKASLIFFNNNIGVFCDKVVKHLTS